MCATQMLQMHYCNNYIGKIIIDKFTILQTSFIQSQIYPNQLQVNSEWFYNNINENENNNNNNTSIYQMCLTKKQFSLRIIHRIVII